MFSHRIQHYFESSCLFLCVNLWMNSFLLGFTKQNIFFFTLTVNFIVSIKRNEGFSCLKDHFIVHFFTNTHSNQAQALKKCSVCMYNKINLGPVVRSIVNLTSSLTALVSTIANSHLFLLKR